MATLTLARGRAVTGEVLAHRVWGGDAPAAARSVVYGHLARLRTLLAEHPDVVLHRATADGYRMTIPDDAVDLFLARRLARDAATAPKSEAVALWRRAAELWRGPALGGIAGGWAETVRSRLRSEHLELLTGLYDAELATGRASAIIPELEEHVLAEPLAENLTARLMTALWTVGRPGDALRRYAAARNALRDRLGRDPGTELRDLHRAILAADTGPAAPPPISTTTVPAQLPADSAAFTGRATELDSLITHVTDAIDTRSPGTVVVSAVDGMAGIGKTALVIRAANAIADRFPDGQLFIDLHGFTANLPPVGPSDALARLLRGLGVADTEIPDNLDDRAAAFRTALANRRVLIVLDNAANEEQIRPLLPGASGCLVLITSRRSLVALDDVVSVSLEVLSVDDAVDLLLRASGRTDADRDDARRLVDLCGRLPLAVRIAAARLRSRPRWTIRDLHDRIGDERRLLSELEAGERSVAAAFAVSYRELDDEHRRVFRLLGLVPGSDISTDAVAALTADTTRTVESLRDNHSGTATSVVHTADSSAETRSDTTTALTNDTVHTVESLLEDLVDAHLIESDGPGRYRMHDLMRLYARHLVDTEVDEATRVAARTRLYWWYAATTVGFLKADASSHALDEPEPVPGVVLTVFADRDEGLAWLATERTNLLAVLDALTEHGPTSVLLWLAECLSRFYLDSGDGAAAGRAAELGLWAAERDGDLYGVSRMYYELGQWHNATGRQHDSIRAYESGLAAARVVDKPTMLVALHTSLAGSLYTLGRLDDAANHCRLAILAEDEDSPRRDAPRNILALVSDLSGRLAEAAEQLHLVERSQIAHKGRFLHLVVSNLAIVYTRLGDVAAAERHALEGHRLGESLGVRKFTAAHLGNIARVRLFQGSIVEARELAADALAAAIDSQTRLQEPFCLNTIAMVHHGDGARAVADAEAALRRSRELEAHPEEVEALILLASALLVQGDADAAERTARRAVDLARDRGYGVALAQALTVLAGCLGDRDEARRVAADALDRHRVTGHRPGEIRALLTLAAIAEESDNPETANHHRTEAARIQSACGIPPHLDLLTATPL